MATPREDLERLRKLKRLKELESRSIKQPVEQDIFENFNPMTDLSVGGVTPQDIQGTANLAQNIATGLAARPIAGGTALADIVQGEGVQGAETVQRITEQIQTPLSAEGQQVAQNIGSAISSLGDNPAFAKVGQILQDAQSALTETGGLGFASLSDPLGTAESIIEGDEVSSTPSNVGRAVFGALPETALEVAAFAGAAPTKALKVAPLPILSKPVKSIINTVKTAAKAPGKVIDDAAEISKGLFRKQSATKREIARLLSEGSADAQTAGFKLIDEPLKQPSKLEKALNIGGPRVKADALANETIKQGFDEGVVAVVKGSTPLDKSKMLRQVSLMERGKNNAREAIFNRPAGVAGDSLLERFKVVVDANKKSGKELDIVAKSLKGQKVDHSGAVNSFMNDIDDMGIRVNDNFTLDFRGSVLEGASTEARNAQSILNTTVKRLLNTKTPDAFDVHRMKKFIDSQVTFGKTQSGMAGGSERILKSLRRGLDDSLDSAFPQYDKVNKTFAETRGAIDNLQDVAGKKMNLFGKNADEATGTLLRRLMSNDQSRIPLLDSIEEIEKIAVRNGGKFNDDIISQVLFADELDAVFKPVARTSLQGQFIQGASDVPVTTSGAVIKGAEKIIEKTRGVNDKNAFEAIKRLLQGDKK